MTSLRFPYRPTPSLATTFVESRLKLRWSDLAFAMSNDWLDKASLVRLARKLAGDDRGVIQELACALDDDGGRLHSVLDRKAALEGVEAETSERWMHLAVSWLYQQRDDLADP